MSPSIHLLYGLLLLLPLISSLPSFPLSPLRAVQRRTLLPDLIKPTFCPTPCEKVFGASARDSGEEQPDLSGPCLCFCPPDRPIYLNALGFCVERPPEECRSAVLFDDFPLDEVPVLTIDGPEGAEKTLNTTLSWSGEFRLSADFTPCCHVADVLVDSALHRWDSSSAINFVLNKTEEGQPRVIFNGTDEEAMNLSGAVVQLKVACSSLGARIAREDEVHVRPPLLCITFRVEGESVSAPLELFHGESTAQVIVLGTVAVVLLLALIASALAYFLCWRIQKQRLIGNIQLQFIAHLKNANLAQVHGNTMSPLPHHQPGHHRQMSISSSSSNGSSNCSGVVQKRRLYFSSEFFEPDCLLNPPPMAEQFLSDIRRMIDMARERIKARRYLPRMNPVFEAEDEDEHQDAEPVRPSRDRSALGVVVCPPDHSSPPSSAEESPRSAKSTDSGRETLDSATSSSSSDDSKSEEEEEEKEEQETAGAQDPPVRAKKQRTSSIPVPPSMSMRAPKPVPPAIPPKPQPSMIPRLGQASPKLQSRSLSAPAPLAETGDQPTPVAPSSLPGPSQRRHERRKGYAVFPADPMLNKSLPRRPRRAASMEQ